MNSPFSPDAMSPRVPKVIRKVLVTLMTSGLAFAITQLASDSDPIWPLTLAVFIGGVALVVQYLVDFENRVGKVEATQAYHFGVIEKLINDKFASINEATRLFGLVEGSMLRTDVVTQLVQNSTRLNRESRPLIYDFAQAEIGRISTFVKELSEGDTAGDVTCDGEDRDWLLGLTQSARNAIDATSLAGVDAGGQRFDDGFWFTDLGQKYLDAQREAVQRGVSVRRVFVLDRPDRMHDPDLARICKLHQKMGIQVRALDPSTLTTTLRHSLFDFIVFDDEVSYETTPAAWTEEGMRPAIVYTRLVLRRKRVDDRVSRFGELWAAAQEVPDVQPQRQATLDPAKT